MVEIQQTHPDRQKLTEFGLGKLSPDDASAVERHLTECESCCETLLHLGDDTFVGLVRSSRKAATDSEAEFSLDETPFDATVVQPGDGQSIDAAASAPSRTEPVSMERDSSGFPAALADHPRYRLVELLGKGGMGDVYKAEHKLMNRPVALKVINRKLVRNEHAVERFRREVQAAARLSHPNIVTAYDAEQAGDVHFLAMEYVDGIDLDALVKQRGPLPVEEACDYIRQAAEGLQHAHEHGMVHRDVKPHNIIVESRESRVESKDRHSPPSTIYPPLSIKILDFGLASFATEAAVEAAEIDDDSAEPTPVQLTTVGTLMGTPDFIAPEQSQDSHAADIRSDIYGLGCTLYYLLTGKPPFPEGSVVEKLKAHAESDAQPIGELRGDLPAGLDDVVGRMLAKDPAERYQTPAAVAAALKPYSEAPKPEVAAKPGFFRRRPIAAALSVIAPLLLFAAAVFYIQLGKTTLRIEVLDSSVAVKFLGDTVQIVEGSKTFDVAPGTEQRFKVLQNGTEVETDSLTLKKGQKIVLTISVVNGEIQITPSDLNVQIGSIPAGQLALLDGHSHWVWSVAASPDGRLLASASQDKSIKLWNADTHELLTTLSEHGGPVFAVAFSPDGKVLASGSGDRTVKLWDVNTRKAIATLTKHRGPVRSVVFSPDGTLLASAGGDKTVRLWDVAKRKQLAELSGHEATVYGLAFSPDGRTLASAGEDQAARLWNVEQHTELRKIPVHGTQAYCVAFSPDGKTLASGDMSKSVRLWDVETGRLLARLSGHSQRVFSLEFTRDGGTLVSASWDKTIRFWDVESRKLLHTLRGHEEHVKCITILPDGKTLASAAGDNTVRIWDVPESVWPQSKSATTEIAEIYRFDKHTERTQALAFTPDGKHIISAGAGTIFAWQPTTGTLFWESAAEQFNTRTVALSPRGDQFATAGQDGHLSIWSTQTGERLSHTDLKRGRVESMAWSPVGDMIAMKCWDPEGAATFWLWDVERKEFVTEFRKDDEPVQSLKFSPDGRRIVTGGYTQQPRVWDVATGQVVLRLEGHAGKNFSVAWSPDGRHILTGAYDGTVKLSNAQTGVLLKTFHQGGEVSAVAFLPDGRHAIAGSQDDHPVTVWNLSTGEVVAQSLVTRVGIDGLAVSPDGRHFATAQVGLRMRPQPDADLSVRVWRLPESVKRMGHSEPVNFSNNREFKGHTGTVKSVAISPDGKLAASASGWPFGDGTLRLWDLETGKQLRQFKGHTDQVMVVVFSPHGRRLLSGSADGTARMWDVATGEQLDVLPNHEGPVEAVAFLPDGRRVLTSAATTDGSGTIRLWDADTGKPLKTLGRAIGKLLAMVVSPDGRRAITGEDENVRVWDLQSGEVVQTIAAHGKVESLAFSHNGRSIAVATTSGRQIHVWNLEAGAVFRRLTGTDGIRSVDFTPDDRRVVAAGLGGVVHVWDVGTGRETARSPKSEEIIWSVAVTSDGRNVLTGGGSKRISSAKFEPGNDYALRLWRLPESLHAPPDNSHNSLGMTLRLIPAGEFDMGSTDQVLGQLQPRADWFFSEWVNDRRRGEMPRHRVRITKPYYMAAYEVTVGQFRQFVEATGYKTASETDPDGGVGYDDGDWQYGREFSWKAPGFPQEETHPVCNLAWEDAVAFCRWLSEKEGAAYRLPTEAEWEYACRAGTDTLFHTGNEAASLKGAANLADRSLAKTVNTVTWAVDWDDTFPFTAPVGKFAPNKFGLHDMHGNAWEWCSDLYDTDYYSASPQDDPPGAERGSVHVFRGGGFDNWPGFLRSADRYSSHSPYLRSEWAGFRVVQEIKPK